MIDLDYRKNTLKVFGFSMTCLHHVFLNFSAFTHPRRFGLVNHESSRRWVPMIQPCLNHRWVRQGIMQVSECFAGSIQVVFEMRRSVQAVERHALDQPPRT